MSRRRLSSLSRAMALVVCSAGFQVFQANACAADPVQAGDGVEVLTRGPVHEAFAEVIAFDHVKPAVVANAPPEAIHETVPDQRPDGANVAWIPGYWAWDDEHAEYLWVSGLWRFLPPGRQWVPGYWGQVEGGYQWTAGYWADADGGDAVYLPQPPEMTNTEPDGPAPSANQTWIPGVPVWNNNQYTMTPGYWANAQNGWDWIPAHYVGSPRGYVFVNGYWDYSASRRGILFAPVSFGPGVTTGNNFSYSPVNVINTTALLGSLFLRPSYGHYYFGDYYASNYVGMGIYPQYTFHNNQGYDPFYAQQSWQNRQNSNWQQSMKTQFVNRRDNESARPPRTLTAQNELIKSGKSKDAGLIMATPIQELAKNKNSPLKLKPVSESDRTAHEQRDKQLQTHRAERAKLESDSATKAAADGRPSEKVKMPASPFVARSTEALGADHIPPKPHVAAKVVTGKPALPDASQRTPKTEVKEPPKNVPQPSPKPEPKTELKPLPKIEPKAEPKPATRPEPKAEPKPAPRPEPKAAPRPEPNAEPKVQPKAESKPAPRPEPKAAPRAEPKAPPKSEPKTAPKTEPKGNPKTL